jgi:hypothetical protein
MAQRMSKAFQKGSVEAFKFTLTYVGIGILLWLFVMVLTSTLQIVAGIDLITLDYSSTTVWFEITGWDCVLKIPEFLGGGCAISVPTGVWHTKVTERTLDIDVATYIIVGAVDIILQVFHTLILVIGMILVWLINAFIFGEDSQGNLLNPLSLFQVLKLIPLIQDIVAGVHGIDESIILSLDEFLTAIDDLFYGIANGFFTGIARGWYNIAEGILGKGRT